jgi:hypothetical protein
VKNWFQSLLSNGSSVHRYTTAAAATAADVGGLHVSDLAGASPADLRRALSAEGCPLATRGRCVSLLVGKYLQYKPFCLSSGNRSTYQMKPFCLSSETVLPIK